MTCEPLERVLESPDPQTVDALLGDRSTVFRVDWREEDDAIVEYCEDVLQTGTLSAETVPTDTGEGYAMYVRCRDRRVAVPLTYGPEDRHRTLLALNQALAPEYEVRFCIDSNGGDTLAFVPLPAAEWTRLEARYGDAVSKRFYKIADTPNLFTESTRDLPPPMEADTRRSGSPLWQRLLAALGARHKP